MSSLRNFAIVLLGVSVVMAGAVAWFATLDHDQHYYYETSYDQQPPSVDRLGYYEDMSPDQQRIVDGAIDGKSYVLPDDATVPPPLVKKDDTYHKFVYFKTFDWSDPMVALSTLIMLLGGLVTLDGIRREQFPHTDMADVKYHMPFIGGK